MVRQGKEGGWEVCMIRRSRYRGEAWCLPKGHVEAREDEEAAALREVREETGLTGKIVEPLGKITYSFTDPQDNHAYIKTVTFYLMHAIAGTAWPSDGEALEVRWMRLPEAMRRATYENERQILERVQQNVPHS